MPIEKLGKSNANTETCCELTFLKETLTDTESLNCCRILQLTLPRDTSLRNEQLAN